MKYKINIDIKTIQSPIVLFLDRQELMFKNGMALANEEFETPYFVESITAKDGLIYITVQKKDNIPSADWTDEKDVSFF